MGKIQMFRNPIKEVIDLSHEVSENMENISGWATAFPVMDTIAKTKQLSGGKVGYAAQMILMSEHTGTHIDAPRHFVEDGMDVAAIPVEQLCLPGHLLDLTHRKVGEAITVEDFEEAEKASGMPVGPGTALICWTGVDKVWGQKNMNRIRPHIPAESAQWMVRKRSHCSLLTSSGWIIPTNGMTRHIGRGSRTISAWFSSSAISTSSFTRISCFARSRSRPSEEPVVRCALSRWSSDIRKRAGGTRRLRRDIKRQRR